MSESSSHKRAKSRAAGKQGKTEVPISRNRRLDARTKSTATEVERSGNLKDAVSRLKASGKRRKVLQVPQPDMSRAADEMQRQRVSGTVKNMSGTKRRSVSKTRRPR